MQSLVKGSHSLAQWYENTADLLPTGFYKNMTIALARKHVKEAKATKWVEADRCAYHEHDEEVPACT